MTLGLGINQIATANKWAGVEVSAVNQVSNEIFSKERIQAVDLNQVNLAAFKRAELGLDLYSGKTNVELQKQISLINSGHLQTHAVANTFLNAQAASTLYPPMGTQRTLEESGSKVVTELQTANVSKDKKGSGNPFTFSGGHQESHEKAEGLNFVA